MNNLLPVERLLTTMETVSKEGEHLAYSLNRIRQEQVTPAWVQALDSTPQKAEQLEAFVSRFGRMQDTIADKLLPRWLSALAERAGGQIEVLNRAEHLGVITSVEQWLEARKLRNRLIHEYMESPEAFAEDIQLAITFTSLLFESYQQLREYAITHMGIESEQLPVESTVTL